MWLRTSEENSLVELTHYRLKIEISVYITNCNQCTLNNYSLCIKFLHYSISQWYSISLSLPLQPRPPSPGRNSGGRLPCRPAAGAAQARPCLRHFGSRGHTPTTDVLEAHTQNPPQQTQQHSCLPGPDWLTKRKKEAHHRGEQQGSGSQQSPERLNSVVALNYPEETLRVPST